MDLLLTCRKFIGLSLIIEYTFSHVYKKTTNIENYYNRKQIMKANNVGDKPEDQGPRDKVHNQQD